MQYKTGQAVVAGKKVLFVQGYDNFLGEHQFISMDDRFFDESEISPERPATEAEILADAVKHGCVKKDYYEYNFNGFEFYKSPFTGWVLLKYVPVETETLRQFCNDGLFVDRIITALNLVNN